MLQQAGAARSCRFPERCAPSASGQEQTCAAYGHRLSWMVTSPAKESPVREWPSRAKARRIRGGMRRTWLPFCTTGVSTRWAVSSSTECSIEGTDRCRTWARSVTVTSASPALLISASTSRAAYGSRSAAPTR